MKKVLLTLGVMCFSLIAVHISTAEIDFETAVGIWLFDEGKGGVAGDISGQGNDGELVKAPSWVDGKFGKALEFDGKASCVQTGQKLLDNLEEFTILTWVQTTDTPVNRTGLVGQNDSPEFGFITAQAVNLWTPTAGGTQNPWKYKHGTVNGITSGVSLRRNTSIPILMVNTLRKKVVGQITAHLPLTSISVDVVFGIQVETSSQVSWTKSPFSTRHSNRKIFKNSWT